MYGFALTEYPENVVCLLHLLHILECIEDEFNQEANTTSPDHTAFLYDRLSKYINR